MLMEQLWRKLNKMKKHLHKYKHIGYFNGGFGVSTNCMLYWCAYCGSIAKSYQGNKPDNDRGVCPKYRKIK